MSIEIATLEDTTSVMRYLRDHWKTDHILGTDRELFLCQYKSGQNLNMIVWRDDETGEIEGLCGYIAANSESSPDLWAAMWHSRKQATAPLRGLQLMQYLRERVPHRGLSCGGINPKTRNLYTYLGSRCDVFSQYYLPNREMPEFRIAVFPNRPACDVKAVPLCRLQRIERPEQLAAFDLEATRGRIPFKDLGYLRKRYFDYPIFQYEVYGFRRETVYSSLVMLRDVPANHSHCLRLVDFIGDVRDWPAIVGELYGLVLDRRAEYLDFLNFGAPREALLSAGFRELDLEGDRVVVPNYFAPFVRKNVKIHLMYDETHGMPLTLCKADGDQDRPNAVAESSENEP